MKSKKHYLEIIKNNPHKIGIACGYKDLKEIHNTWIKMFLYAKEDYLLLAHRGSYKTTCLIIAIALLMIIKPHITIIVQRKTDDDVVEIVKGVEKLLTNKLFKLICFALWKIEIKVKSNQTEIYTNLMKKNTGGPQLRGLGTTSSLTGKHADRIFTDDIVNIKDRTSEAERKRIKLVYQELRNIVNRGGIIGNTGTPWHKEDAFVLMPKPIIYNCYETGLIDKDNLAKIRKSMTPSLFAANYELKHIADENALFKNPRYTDNYEAIYNGQCHIDAGYDGEDFTAFTIMKRKGDKVVGYGKVWNKHVDDCLEEILILHNKYRAGSFNLETNADKGYLAKTIRELSRKLSKITVTVNEYHESMNKDLKIKTNLYKHWDNIEWIDITDNEYMNMILDYNEDAAHDDSPDSAASLIRRLFDGGEASFTDWA